MDPVIGRDDEFTIFTNSKPYFKKQSILVGEPGTGKPLLEDWP